MTKKEECFKLFEENDAKTRIQAIQLAISKLGITQATAQTYYPAWRKEYKDKPGYISPEKLEKEKKQGKVNNIIKSTGIITEAANNITKKAVIIPKIKIISREEIKGIVKEVKEKAYEKPVIIEAEKKNEDILEITRLRPLAMKGKYGTYKFDKDGVKAELSEEFLSKDKVYEALEALEIWERSYNEGGSQLC